jgi:hypothetical protein
MPSERPSRPYPSIHPSIHPIHLFIPAPAEVKGTVSTYFDTFRRKRLLSSFQVAFPFTADTYAYNVGYGNDIGRTG